VVREIENEILRERERSRSRSRVRHIEDISEIYHISLQGREKREREVVGRETREIEERIVRDRGRERDRLERVSETRSREIERQKRDVKTRSGSVSE